MAWSGAAPAVTASPVWLGPSPWLYGCSPILMGCSWAVWLLARIAFAAGSSPLRHRGRVMSMIGGVHRIGLLLGPLLGSEHPVLSRRVATPRRR